MKKYIVSDPKIMSGHPVIADTRIPLSRILFLLKEGYSVEEIHQMYDHVSIRTLELVIDEIKQIIEKSIHDDAQVL